jgi:hypothetical protein
MNNVFSFLVVSIGLFSSNYVNHRESSMNQFKKLENLTPKVSLKWSMKLENQNLKVAYSVKNRSSSRFYIAESILVIKKNKFFRVPEALIVMNTNTSGKIKLIKGAVFPDLPVAVIYQATYKALEPEEIINDIAEIAMPIKSWHNIARVNLLNGVPSSAILQIEYFLGEPSEWIKLPSAENTSILVPKGQKSQFFNFESILIPQK